jgi:hypothetical protein
MLSAIRRQPVRFGNSGFKMTGRGGAAPLRPDRYWSEHRSLVSQLLGLSLKPFQGLWRTRRTLRFCQQTPAWESIPPLLDRASPLRTAHLRDPVGPQIQCVSESFIDDIAAANRRRPGCLSPAKRAFRHSSGLDVRARLRTPVHRKGTFALAFAGDITPKYNPIGHAFGGRCFGNGTRRTAADRRSRC